MFCRVLICFLLFFFKQKTAYEMRISDWSSDVCSSDLKAIAPGLAINVQHIKARPLPGGNSNVRIGTGRPHGLDRRHVCAREMQPASAIVRLWHAERRRYRCIGEGLPGARIEGKYGPAPFAQAHRFGNTRWNVDRKSKRLN